MQNWNKISYDFRSGSFLNNSPSSKGWVEANHATLRPNQTHQGHNLILRQTLKFISKDLEPHDKAPSICQRWDKVALYSSRWILLRDRGQHWTAKEARVTAMQNSYCWSLKYWHMKLHVLVVKPALSNVQQLFRKHNCKHPEAAWTERICSESSVQTLLLAQTCSWQAPWLMLP